MAKRITNIDELASGLTDVPNDGTEPILHGSLAGLGVDDHIQYQLNPTIIKITDNYTIPLTTSRNTFFVVDESVILNTIVNLPQSLPIDYTITIVNNSKAGVFVYFNGTLFDNLNIGTAVTLYFRNNTFNQLTKSFFNTLLTYENLVNTINNTINQLPLYFKDDIDKMFADLKEYFDNMFDDVNNQVTNVVANLQQHVSNTNIHFTGATEKANFADKYTKAEIDSKFSELPDFSELTTKDYVDTQDQYYYDQVLGGVDQNYNDLLKMYNFIVQSVTDLKDGVPASYDTLNKLYELVLEIIGGLPEGLETLGDLYDYVNYTYGQIVNGAPADGDTLLKVNNKIDNAVTQLLGGVSQDGNTLKKLYDLIQNLRDYVDGLVNIGGDFDNLSELAAAVKTLQEYTDSINTDLTNHINNDTVHFTAGEKSNLNNNIATIQNKLIDLQTQINALEGGDDGLIIAYDISDLGIYTAGTYVIDFGIRSKEWYPAQGSIRLEFAQGVYDGASELQKSVIQYIYFQVFNYNGEYRLDVYDKTENSIFDDIRIENLNDRNAITIKFTITSTTWTNTTDPIIVGGNIFEAHTLEFYDGGDADEFEPALIADDTNLIIEMPAEFSSTEIPLASATENGLMSSVDKVKLDAATNSPTANTLVLRDASGNANFVQVTATTFNGALTGNATTATTAGNVTGVVQISNGGTGATTNSGAVSALFPTVNTTSTGIMCANGANYANPGYITAANLKIQMFGSGAVGSATQPIYFAANAVPTAITQANLRISVFGTTAIGSGTKPVYFAANGVPTVSSSTVGSTQLPVYLNAGTITAITQANLRIGIFGTNAIGSASKPVYIAANGVPTALTSTVGSTQLPVYLNAGTVTAITQANLRIGIFGTAAIGSNTNPIYFAANGVPTAMTGALPVNRGGTGVTAIGTNAQISVERWNTYQMRSGANLTGLANYITFTW